MRSVTLLQVGKIYPSVKFNEGKGKIFDVSL